MAMIITVSLPGCREWKQYRWLRLHYVHSVLFGRWKVNCLLTRWNYFTMRREEKWKQGLTLEYGFLYCSKFTPTHIWHFLRFMWKGVGGENTDLALSFCCFGHNATPKRSKFGSTDIWNTEMQTWYRPKDVFALQAGEFLQNTCKLRTSLLQQLSLKT